MQELMEVLASGVQLRVGPMTYTVRVEVTRAPKAKTPATEPLLTVQQFCEAEPAFTPGGVRWMIFCHHVALELP